MSYKKGFTLIEILVILIIIAILAAVALPNYQTMVMQGAATAAQKNLITIYNAERNYAFVNNGVYCTGSTGLPSPCGNILANINTNLATLNQATPTITNLNISDNNFTYACADDASGFSCTATNITNTSFILTVKNNAIVLPGGSGTANPSCVDVANPAYCPS